jgi:hypothetical protein
MTKNARMLYRAAAALLFVGAMALTHNAFVQAASAQENVMKLFKIITVKDEIVVGLSPDELVKLKEGIVSGLSSDELGKLGGQDAGAIAKTLAAKGEMTVWQYAVRKNANGDLEQAPLHQVGVLANNSLRVEPYSTPLKVLPHE